MFEKDAEEYLKKDGTKAEQILNMLNEISPLKITSKQIPFILAMIQQIFQDGAEIGYNKANKWHFVKDGDLPKDFGYYLVALKSIAYKGFVFEVVYFTGSIFTKEGEISDNVYAWKEIVLPKESE